MTTFAGIHPQLADSEKAGIYLQSVPYDGTSTWGKGADKGFDAFLDAANNMELYDIETDTEVYKIGIHMPEVWDGFSSPEDMFEKVYSNTKKLLKTNKFLSFFGGEHSVSIGIIKAYKEKYKNLSVLQLDAHADLRPEYNNTKYNHACALHETRMNCNLVQVGIRSMDFSEKQFMDFEKVYFAKDIMGAKTCMSRSIDQLGEDVYITLDLDVLDPSVMPATGTPEPGGLDWYQLTRYLSMVFAKRNVVGFDIVELAPIEGIHAPQFLTAKLYYKMLTYKFLNHE